MKLKHDTSKPFACSNESCDKKFSILQHLKRHEKTHEKDLNPFVCTICSQAFSKKLKLREHRKDQHNIAEFICMTNGCNKLFPSQSKLDAHKNTHKQRYMCLEPNCYLMMTNYNDFRRHKAFEHKQNSNNTENDNDTNTFNTNSDDNFCQVINSKKRKGRWDNHHTTTSSSSLSTSTTNDDDTDDSNNNNTNTNINQNYTMSTNPSFQCNVPGCVRTYVKAKYLRDHVRAVHSEVGFRFPCTEQGCEQR
jgi:hypothetical protein